LLLVGNECSDPNCREIGPHPGDNVFCLQCADEEESRQNLHNLMEAVKYILLNMRDREEMYDDNDKLYPEFAQLYLAFRAMGGSLGFSDEEELAQDCMNLE
jgi:hypothetical protein